MTETTDFPECEQFTGHWKAICRGESQRPLNGPSSTNSYRKHWGLDPIGDVRDIAPETLNVALPPKIHKPRVQLGVGTELKKLTGRLLLKTCGSCSDHADELDARPVSWAENNIETIIGWMKAEAASRNIGWVASATELIPIFGLSPRELVEKAIINAKVEITKWREQQTPPRRGSSFQFDGGQIRFISTAQYMADCHKLATMLPLDTSFIIGIGRSGLCAATMVSMLLHLPLKVLRQHIGSKGVYDLVDGGNGTRLTGNIGGQGAPVVIDDTVMSGNSFKYSLPAVRSHYPKATSAAVYVNPFAKRKPDQWVVDLTWPHVLEWNAPNSILSQGCALDFDGILCHDCPGGSDDDGPRYEAFLRDAKLLYAWRRCEIPLIVTARLEKYRPQTLNWLARHGMSVRNLVMWPGSNHRERSTQKVSEYKAQHYAEFVRTHTGIKPPMFWESDVRQAELIAKISKGVVVCPAAGKCF